jgi:ribosomal protein S18 acetylase RimI-like enzyme
VTSDPRHGLRRFDPALAGTVLGWVASDDEARRWASLAARPTDPAIFDRWHAEEGVRPYLFVSDGSAAGYGEIWEDRDEDEAELARLIVDPTRRGRGLGRTFVAMLLAEARRLGWASVWLRVAPDNDAALHAYLAAGFTRATEDEETAFNAGQPDAYVWLRGPEADRA